MRDMARRRLDLSLLLVAGSLAFPPRGAAVPVAPVTLWQESYYWDGLLEARSRAARQSADPNLLPVLKSIAQQMAQQALNLRQVEAYTKVQQENLRFAFSQSDPGESLATIQSNLETLAKGTAQIRGNLFFLAARCRMASSQALPDPELTAASTALIKQIQGAQLRLNALYSDAAAIQGQLKAQAPRPKENFLRYRANLLVRSVLETQSSILSVYNASYEIYLRSKQ